MYKGYLQKENKLNKQLNGQTSKKNTHKKNPQKNLREKGHLQVETYWWIESGKLILFSVI